MIFSPENNERMDCCLLLFFYLLFIAAPSPAAHCQWHYITLEMNKYLLRFTIESTISPNIIGFRACEPCGGCDFLYSQLYQNVCAFIVLKRFPSIERQNTRAPICRCCSKSKLAVSVSTPGKMSIRLQLNRLCHMRVHQQQCEHNDFAWISFISFQSLTKFNFQIIIIIEWKSMFLSHLFVQRGRCNCLRANANAVSIGRTNKWRKTFRRIVQYAAFITYWELE